MQTPVSSLRRSPSLGAVASSRAALVPVEARALSPLPPKPPAFLALREPPPATLEAAIGQLGALSRRLAAQGDRRAIFPAIYEMQVRAMAADLAVPGRYADPAWMTRMALDFAQRYFDAFDAYEQGDRAAVPEAWLRAFDHARQARGPVTNELMLSMNAHINHDLALSVAATGGEPSHRKDFERFNACLKANVDGVQALLEGHLRPRGSIAGTLDKLAGPLDEWLAGRMIAAWRATAWRHAMAIAQRGEPAYAPVVRRATWNARVIDAVGQAVPASWVKRGLI
ncbi:MAG: DUF5995 family protein [Candidatus Sericytochromatia bacterium]|nr:DUF5995 family protein [Candidatus Sericytochromatia bacterium]